MLHSVTSCRKGEYEVGWTKTSVNDDIPHVLKSIINGLDSQMEWPDVATRQIWASEHNGVFRGNIGFGDVKETAINKPLDPVLA